MENSESKGRLFKIGENDEKSNVTETESFQDQEKKKLAQQAIDQAAKLVTPPVYTAPTFNAPVYSAPAYPGPPGFTPTVVPTTTLPAPSVTSGGIAPPTFVYQSAYTGETMKFDGKAYGTAEFAQVPTYIPKSGTEDEDEFEALEIKLDIEITSLKAELQVAEQEATEFTTLQTSLSEKKESLSQLESSNRAFFFDQEYQVVQSELQNTKNEQQATEKQIKQLTQTLRSAQLKVVNEKQKNEEAEKEIQAEIDNQSEINKQVDLLSASFATVQRYLQQEKEQNEQEKLKSQQQSSEDQNRTTLIAEDQQQKVELLKKELYERQELYTQLKKTHDEVDEKLFDIENKILLQEQEAEEQYEKIEFSYRENEDLTTLQIELMKTNQTLKKTKAQLSKKNSQLESTLQFLEMYFDECTQNLQEANDEQNTLKNINWIHQQLVDLLNSYKADTEQDSADYETLIKEKMTFDEQIETFGLSQLDQERQLLLINTTLPESGVMTKQLNAEIYQTKISLQQNETEEEGLKEKFDSLQSVLNAEKQQMLELEGEQQQLHGGLLESLESKYQSAVNSHQIMLQELNDAEQVAKDHEILKDQIGPIHSDAQQRNEQLKQVLELKKTTYQQRSKALSGFQEYSEEIKNLLEDAQKEKEVYYILFQIQQQLHLLSQNHQAENLESGQQLSEQMQQQTELKKEIEELQQSNQKQEKAIQLENSALSATSFQAISAENQMQEAGVLLDQLKFEEQTLTSKSQTLNELLQAENTQISLMKSESEDSLGSFLQQLAQKHSSITEKHEATDQEIQQVQSQNLSLQTQIEQLKTDLQRTIQSNSELKVKLSQENQSGKSNEDKKLFASNYLTEVEKLLDESQQLQTEMKQQRLEQIQKILEDFEKEKQKQIQWVDYAVQETPSPKANEATKLRDDADLIKLEAIPENLRQDRPSEAMRPSIFEMQRKNAQQQSYRATTYDKTKIKRPTVVENKQVVHTDQTVLLDLIVCQLSGIKMLTLQSDLELNQGFSLFTQMLQDDPKCHEGMFGLARINYIQGRYEIAEKWLMKAYETKRDFAYRVWLGFTQLQLAKICLIENPKKQKFAQNAFSNLDRCSKERKVGLYANFGLLQMALDFKELEIKGLQEPLHYQGLIVSDYIQEGYEGQLSNALIDLHNNNTQSFVAQLSQLCKKGVSLAYFVLIKFYLKNNRFDEALAQALEADSKHDLFESSQERLASLVLLCKCYKKAGQSIKAIVTLQERYVELPHYSSILYLFGKTIVQSQQLHTGYIQSGISALEEVERVSCQIRKAKAAFWLSEAFKLTGQNTRCGLYQAKYLAQITQVTKSGAIVQKLPENLVDARVQSSVISQVAATRWSDEQQIKDPQLLSPQDCIPGQALNALSASNIDKDLVIACMKISDHRDQQLYKAITLYKIKEDYQKADPLFQNLIKEYPNDVEIGLENLKFIKSMLKLKITLRRQSSVEKEVENQLELIQRLQTDANIWAQSLIECFKIYSILSETSDSLQLKLKALECLLKIKQALPVIDTKLAAVKVPESLNRYLFEEFDHIDFQSLENQPPPLQNNRDIESSEFKPQDDYDETNKFFSQNQYTQNKLLSCPLATLSLAEIKDQIRVKGDSLFFFGAAQTELAYEAEANSNSEVIDEKQRKFYQSSTPLITVLKFLQHLERQQSGQSYSEKQIKPEFLKDYGFCVYSDPSFLYKIAKMCYKNGFFIDLAIHSLYVYQQVMSYYRHFYDWTTQEIKAKLLLGLLLKKMSTQPQVDNQIVEKLITNLKEPVTKAYEKVKYLPNKKVTKFEYDSLKQGKLLTLLLES